MENLSLEINFHMLIFNVILIFLITIMRVGKNLNFGIKLILKWKNWQQILFEQLILKWKKTKNNFLSKFLA